MSWTKALIAPLAAPFVKALTAMRHPVRTFGGWMLRRTRFDYAREVGDGLDSSVVTAPVQWLQRALPEATLSLRRRKRGGQFTPLDDHPMLAVIRRPNDHYGDAALWFGTVLSWCIDGNAYWLKMRNLAGQVVQLWYVPHWMIEPVTLPGSAEFIDHYRYSPGGAGPIEVEPADVVHFRHGIDPRDVRKGISPIGGALREIFGDLESSNFIASLLRNMGVPGVVISPKNGTMPSTDDVAATKSWFDANFKGDGRGGTLVMGAPTDVQQFGFNPQQMDLSKPRDVAEERVCACLGVPAAVVGFGTGMQQTKVGATMSELRKEAWHGGVLPMARALADELQRSLLPDFAREGDLRQLDLYWDTDDVPALQEDEDKQIERKLKELAAGAITLYDYLVETGREAEERDRYYLRQISVIEVPAGGAAAQDNGGPAPAKSLPAPAVKADPKIPSPEAMKRALAFGKMADRLVGKTVKGFEEALGKAFSAWGVEAYQTAASVLSQKSDEEVLDAIFARLGIADWRGRLEQIYGAHYLEVASAVSDAAERAGLGTGLPDLVARKIVAAGGRRVGLVDLDAQTRAAIFKALAEGRAEGDGVDALAKRIGGMVEAGPWTTPQIRARIIARTETKFAQNMSTIERGIAAGVREFVVLDGLLGPGRSLETHIARNGSIVTAEEALVMAAEEHPNGTLGFAPHFDL